MQKKITVPDGWNDVNIATFQELNNVEDNQNKAFEIISILIDEDPEDVKKWDVASFNRVNNALGWVQTLPTKEDFKKVIEIDGIKYGFVEKLSSLSLGQWMDIEHYLQDSIGNLHKLMAMFYRPIQEDGSIEPYDSVSGVDRAELFKEKLSINNCYGALLFFSSIGKGCIPNLEVYFLKETLKMMKQKRKEKLRAKLKSWLGLQKTKN